MLTPFTRVDNCNFTDELMGDFLSDHAEFKFHIIYFSARSPHVLGICEILSSIKLTRPGNGEVIMFGG